MKDMGINHGPFGHLDTQAAPERFKGQRRFQEGAGLGQRSETVHGTCELGGQVISVTTLLKDSVGDPQVAIR